MEFTAPQLGGRRHYIPVVPAGSVPGYLREVTLEWSEDPDQWVTELQQPIEAGPATAARSRQSQERQHLDQPRKQQVSARSLLAQPAVRAACLVQALSQFSAFLVIPQFSAYLLLNLGFPRERLGLLYFAGGVTARFNSTALPS